MKNKQLLNTIKQLIDSEDTQFIPVEHNQTEALYIDYGLTKLYISDVALTSIEIATLFDTTVIAHYANIDLIIEKDDNIENISEQRLIEIHNLTQKPIYRASEAVQNVIDSFDLPDISRKLNELYEQMQNKEFKKYIPKVKLRRLSQTMLNTYKKSLQDEYIDQKVKTFAKQIKRG